MRCQTSLDVTRTLVVEECWVCGVTFAMTAMFQKNRAANGRVFFCPSGCKINYGPSRMEQLERKLDAERTRTQWERDQREATERSLAAQRGVVTKLKKRKEQT